MRSLRKNITVRQIFFLQLLLFGLIVHLCAIMLACFCSAVFSNSPKKIVISTKRLARPVLCVKASELKNKRNFAEKKSNNLVNNPPTTAESTIVPELRPLKAVNIRNNTKAKVPKHSPPQTTGSEKLSVSALSIGGMVESCKTPARQLPNLEIAESIDLRQGFIDQSSMQQQIAGDYLLELDLLDAEVNELVRVYDLADSITANWKPPRGVTIQNVCQVEVLVDQQGDAERIMFISSSGVSSYDSSVRIVLDSIHFPKWARGKSLVFTFGEE